MALNLNKCFVAGRLCADPELKQTTNGISVCTFRVAVNRRKSGNDHPVCDFFTVNAWREQGEFVAKYFRKGNAIMVLGELQNRSWTAQDGSKKQVTEIIASQVEFVESREAATTEAKPVQMQPVGQAANFAEVPTDEDLPF